MIRRVFVLTSIFLISFTAAPQSAPTYTAPASAQTVPLDYVCPMDPDVRSDKPGKCPRCGMTLKLGIPEQAEYTLDLQAPPHIHPGQNAQLRFTFRDPKDGSVVKKFEVMHEKLFHMFVVSGDLKFFVHTHPVQQADGSFTIDQVFPRSGMYRIVADVYPSSGTPQLLVRTVFASGGAEDQVPLAEAILKPDLALQHGENTDVQVVMDPPKPVAGVKTHVWFKFNTADHMQKYLGAWAHMLMSSDDTIDLIHDHPFLADGGPEMQFDEIFPRARTYRVWIQFQRDNVVNTIAVNIPVITLEEAAGVNTASR